MSLESYLRDIKKNQWASQAELAIAAELEGISVWLATALSCQKIGIGNPTHDCPHQAALCLEKCAQEEILHVRET